MSYGRTKLVVAPPPMWAIGVFRRAFSGDFSMQLSGLIPAALRDRGLARARDLARKGFVDSDSLDLTAPAALRPFVVAAVAGAPRRGRRARGGARVPPPQPRGRRPGRGAGLPDRFRPGG